MACLIPLELGGAPEEFASLWPEPWNGDANAHMKDASRTSSTDRSATGRSRGRGTTADRDRLAQRLQG